MTQSDQATLIRLIRAKNDFTLLSKKFQDCIQKQKTCEIIKNLLAASLGSKTDFSFTMHEYKSNDSETNSYQIASYAFLQSLMPKFLQSYLMPHHTKGICLHKQFLKCADLLKYFGLTINYSKILTQ